MPIEPENCGGSSTSLDCLTDSVTVCPPDDDSPFHVIVDNSPPSTPLDCLTDSVTICPGVDPIIVNGTVNIGTMPEVEIKNDVGSPIPVSGTVTATQGTSPWVSSLDAPTLAALEIITVQNPGGASAVNIQDGGNSITVDGAISVTGEVEVSNDTGNPLPINLVNIEAALYAILENLTRPMWWDRISNNLRVLVQDPISTVTTVSSVTSVDADNITAINGAFAKDVWVNNENKISWSANVRARIS